jgi:peptidoglycan/LPS O-acetylase OafA/YrhL
MHKKFIPALTGIRAICMYGIYFKHLNFFSRDSHPELWLFVNQFFCFLTPLFVLSGFVIYYTYSDIANLDRKRLKKFFVHRVARIFPALLLLITLTFYLGYRHGLYSGTEAVKLYLLNITLLKGFSADYFLTGIAATWTLTLEWTFYMLAPFIFILVKKRSGLLKFVLLSYALITILTLFFTAFPYKGFFEGRIFTSQVIFFGRSFEFAMGIYLAMLIKGKASNKWLLEHKNITLTAGLLIILASPLLEYFVASYYGIQHGWDTWPGLLVNHIFLPLGVLLFFFSLVYQRTWIQRFLGSRLMVALGNSTYSFYLLQTSFVFSLLAGYITSNIYMLLLLLIISSYLFFRLVEQPLDRLAKRLLDTKK